MRFITKLLTALLVLGLTSPLTLAAEPNTDKVRLECANIEKTIHNDGTWTIHCELSLVNRNPEALHQTRVRLVDKGVASVKSIRTFHFADLEPGARVSSDKTLAYSFHGDTQEPPVLVFEVTYIDHLKNQKKTRLTL